MAFLYKNLPTEIAYPLTWQSGRLNRKVLFVNPFSREGTRLFQEFIRTNLRYPEEAVANRMKERSKSRMMSMSSER